MDFKSMGLMSQLCPHYLFYKRLATCISILFLLYALFGYLGSGMQQLKPMKLMDIVPVSWTLTGKTQHTLKSSSYNKPLHPSLNQSCYQYHNLEAINTCCATKVYTAKDIETCATTEVNTKSRSNWVFVGNSRIRILFTHIVKRILIDGGNVEFIDPEDRKLPKRVIHKTMPFNMTQYPDHFLKNLPSWLERWLKFPNERPTHLHIGVGVNHMMQSAQIYNESGQEVAGKPYQEAVARVIPNLQKLSKYTNISWWTSEHALLSRVYPEYQKIWSRRNVNYYNDYLRKQLSKTDTAVMDAHMPLGQLFLESCTAAYDYSRCGDNVHQGSGAVIQYAMMILNHHCNEKCS